MKTARPWVKLLGVAAVFVLIAVAMPPRTVWWARWMLVAAAIFVLLAGNGYFGRINYGVVTAGC